MTKAILDQKLEDMINNDLNRGKKNILGSYEKILEELREVPLPVKQKERVVFEAAAILGNYLLAEHFGETYKILEEEYVTLRKLEDSDITPEDRSTIILATAHQINHSKDKIFSAAFQGYRKY